MAVNPKSLKNLNPPKKGEPSRNPSGKPKGAKNKMTNQVREVLQQAIEDNLPAVNKAIDSLLKSENESARSRGIDLVIRLMEYVTPKLQAVAVKSNDNASNIIVIGKPPELEDANNLIADNASDLDSDDIIDITDSGESVEDK